MRTAKHMPCTCVVEQLKVHEHEHYSSSRSDTDAAAWLMTSQPRHPVTIQEKLTTKYDNVAAEWAHMYQCSIDQETLSSADEEQKQPEPNMGATKQVCSLQGKRCQIGGKLHRHVPFGSQTPAIQCTGICDEQCKILKGRRQNMQRNLISSTS